MPTLRDRFLGLLNKKIKKKEPGHLDQSNQPEDPDSGSPDLDCKTQWLHAFRTITLMLSLIHSRKRNIDTNIESNSNLRKELRPLDALAAIAIRQHGIAAAIAMRDDTSGTLEILTSSDSSSSHLPGPTIPQPSSSASTMSQFLTFLLALNPRSDGGRHSSRSTTKGSKESANLLNDENPRSSTNAKIVHPDTEIPESLKGCKESDLLKTYLTDVW